MQKDSLGDRMKSNYEVRHRHFLTRRIPVVLRLDGKAFHTFTKGSEKPFDSNIINTMQSTTECLLKGVQGAKVAYVQSDEISLLLTDYDRVETEAYFDYCQNKIESITAAMASVHFTLEYANARSASSNYPVDHKEAHFDCRAFNVPKEEVVNYFRWRYQDWLRNSIQMLAQSLYSHKELHGKQTPELHDMCMAKGHNWAKLSGECKNGTLFVRTADGIQKYVDFNLKDNNFCTQIFGEYVS